MTVPGGTLKPCLAELLHTCVHPASLLLRVEHVFRQAQTGCHRNAYDSRSWGEVGQEAPRKRSRTITGNRADDTGDSESVSQPSSRTGCSTQHEKPHAPQQCLRLALSDGHLQIQAVLATHLDAVKELEDLQQGELVELKDFEIRSAPRLNGRGSVIYLCVQDCQWAGRDQAPAEPVDDSETVEGGSLHDSEDGMSPKKPCPEEQKPVQGEYRSWSKKRATQSKHGGGQSQSTGKKPEATHLDESDDDGSFDTLAVSQSQINQRRETLRQIRGTPAIDIATPGRLMGGMYGQSRTLGSSTAPLIPLSPIGKRAETADDKQYGGNIKTRADNPDSAHRTRSDSNNALTTVHPMESHSVMCFHPPTEQRAPPVASNFRPETTTLASILSLPIQKGYTCNVFGVVSWISSSIIHRANMPFPSKRHLKIHDPSISTRQSGITVAVFIGAEHFKPQVGTLALIRGLVLHQLRGGEDVILNRYPLKAPSQRLAAEHQELVERENNEDEWFIKDECRLMEMGYDVEVMKTWWEERLAAKEKPKENVKEGS